MQIDEKLLSRLEKLSNLKINVDKRAEIMVQLSEIVGFVDNLSELDTQNIDVTCAITDQATKLREDIIKCNSDISHDILKHAPMSQNDFFIVPKIIE